jgi:hypothetical protein
MQNLKKSQVSPVLIISVFLVFEMIFVTLPYNRVEEMKAYMIIGTEK